MRVLLLGSTGNLGRRLLPALLSYNHTVTLLIRPSSTHKLPLLFSPSLISQISGVVEGDATSVSDIRDAIEKYEIEGVVNVAGNQDRSPAAKKKRKEEGKGFLLERIARAVSEAAVEVGRKRGKVLGVWITAGCEFRNLWSFYVEIFLFSTFNHLRSGAPLFSLSPLRQKATFFLRTFSAANTNLLFPSLLLFRRLNDIVSLPYSYIYVEIGTNF